MDVFLFFQTPSSTDSKGEEVPVSGQRWGSEGRGRVGEREGIYEGQSETEPRFGLRGLHLLLVT